MRLAALRWTGEAPVPTQTFRTQTFATQTLGPVALFEFLSRPAGAGIVAAHFFLAANDLLHWLRFAASGHARLFQFAALAAHEGFFQIVRGSCDQARRTMSVPACSRLRRHSRLRTMSLPRGCASGRTCWGLC